METGHPRCVQNFLGFSEWLVNSYCFWVSCQFPWLSLGYSHPPLWSGRWCLDEKLSCGLNHANHFGKVNARLINPSWVIPRIATQKWYIICCCGNLCDFYVSINRPGVKPNPGFTLSTVFYSKKKYIYIRYLAWATFSHETTRNSPGPLAVGPFCSAFSCFFTKLRTSRRMRSPPTSWWRKLKPPSERSWWLAGCWWVWNLPRPRRRKTPQRLGWCVCSGGPLAGMIKQIMLGAARPHVHPYMGWFPSLNRQLNGLLFLCLYIHNTLYIYL